MSILLKIFLWVLGIVIFVFSFFFGEEDNFSPTRESKEKMHKTTHFTKLTKFIRNIYALLIVIFLVIAFLMQP